MMLQRICRKLGLDPSITALSDMDDTQWLMDRLNQRYQELKRLLPLSPTYLSQLGQLNLVAGQRLYSVPNNVYLPDIFLWSFSDVTSGTSFSLKLAALDVLMLEDLNFRTVQGLPHAVYVEAGQIGLYPVPNQVRVIKYQYRELPPVLSLLTDSFLLPDAWLAYLELAVELDYQLWKGQGLPDATLARLNQQYALIYCEMNRLSPSQFKP